MVELKAFKIECDGESVDIPYKDWDIHAIDQQCDLCGSHGEVTLDFQCLLCDQRHEIELSSW